MDSHIDEFGRIHVSRDDRERLTLQWDRRHGMPTDSGHVIARDQWVAEQVFSGLRKAHNRNPDTKRRKLERLSGVPIN